MRFVSREASEMCDPTLSDESVNINSMTDLQRKVLLTIYEAPNEGLRLWQVQKKVSATKLEVQEALRWLLAKGCIGILSMGGGPKYHKITSKVDIVAALRTRDSVR